MIAKVNDQGQYNKICEFFAVVGVSAVGFEAWLSPTTLAGLSPLLVFVQLGLKPGFHQQHLRVYNSIASASVVVGGGSAACHPHEQQQRRSVGFGLSPLLVFVQLALKPGYHQQPLRVFAVVGVRAVGFEAWLSPTTLAGWTILRRWWCSCSWL